MEEYEDGDEEWLLDREASARPSGCPGRMAKSVTRCGILKVLVTLLMMYMAANYVLVIVGNGDSADVVVADMDVGGSGTAMVVVDAPHGHSEEGGLDGEHGPLGAGEAEEDIDLNGPDEGALMQQKVEQGHQDAEARHRRCDELVAPYNVLNSKGMDPATCEAIKTDCGLQSCDSAMDVVVLWVNGSDPEQVCAMARSRKGTCASRSVPFTNRSGVISNHSCGVAFAGVFSVGVCRRLCIKYTRSVSEERG